MLIFGVHSSRSVTLKRYFPENSSRFEWLVSSDSKACDLGYSQKTMMLPQIDSHASNMLLYCLRSPSICNPKRYFPVTLKVWMVGSSNPKACDLGYSTSRCYLNRFLCLKDAFILFAFTLRSVIKTLFRTLKFCLLLRRTPAMTLGYSCKKQWWKTNRILCLNRFFYNVRILRSETQKRYFSNHPRLEWLFRRTREHADLGYSTMMLQIDSYA
jgi:hypothetical protein